MSLIRSATGAAATAAILLTLAGPVPAHATGPSPTGASGPAAPVHLAPPTREAKLAMLQALGSLAEQERLCGASPERLRADKAAVLAELARAAPQPALTPAETEQAWQSGVPQGRQLVGGVSHRDEWCRNFLAPTH
jgi:hypothetical protein